MASTRTIVAAALAVALASCEPVKGDRAVLSEVNADVNRAIAYETDLKQYRKIEWWVVNPVSGRGDCEDYALTKRAALLARGIAESRMVIWSVKLDYGAGHAVLVVDDELVLDNNYPRVEHKGQLKAVYTAWAPVNLSKRHVSQGGA